MTAFVESLRRLYVKGSTAVTEEKLQSLLSDGKITEKDLKYIKTGEL